MRISVRHPSPALVISCLALTFALGGTSYAAVQALPKNSVGTSQLKNSAVVSTKVKNHSLRGVDINAKTLGTVPNATHAGSADDASHAAPVGAAGGALTGRLLPAGVLRGSPLPHPRDQ